eukprot:TRINITY_DN66312_c5_g1_i1.p1 TRINITY_DN66312_c5_g1~~TRINITY_DN66312_c5_g1_i1.p1  ORF type:complete len:522 (-),score=55.15 TRINITY_DN66312_c5_g1_i1:50-1615(-)
MEQCLNIYLDLNSPEKVGSPDASELAKKYGVSDDENDDKSDDEDERLSMEKRKKPQEESIVEQSETNIELLSKVKQLTNKVTEKNTEIERLCCLLEAVEPVPGSIDPEKFLKMYDNNRTDDPAIDYRDVKIVALAKKVRKYTLALNKERTSNSTLKQSCEELTNKVEKLKKELDLISSPAARAAAIKNMRQDIKKNAENQDINELRKEMQAINKQNEELRRKNTQLYDENKKLTRTLTKEIGKGVNINQTFEDGWRGRSQQILALKSKIKKMEADNVTLTTALTEFQTNNINGNFNQSLQTINEDGNNDDSTILSNANTVLTNTMKSYANTSINSQNTINTKQNVDTKAASIINNMTNDRQQAIENLINEREKLVLDNEKLIKKTTALKSRITNLENDASKSKESMKVLIDKTDSDDQLIELLKAEVARLKNQLKQVTEQLKQQKLEHDNYASSRVQTIKGNGNSTNQKARMMMDGDSLEKELHRVKRLLDQQTAQLNTQDDVIRKLRNNNGNESTNRSYY